MNLENLNLVELNAQEVQEFEGGERACELDDYLPSWYVNCMKMTGSYFDAVSFNENGSINTRPCFS